MTSDRDRLTESNRIVVKIGSSLLEPGPEIIQRLVNQINDLRNQGLEVVLVTSGAIYFGAKSTSTDPCTMTLPRKQATAAIGQPELMNFYQRQFSQHDLTTAQVLLTQREIHNRESYLNASNTLHSLLSTKAIPVVNENDTVATEEIQFGNNDTLAALVSTLVDADACIILSDVEGLYEGEPSPDAEPISTVHEINQNIRDWAGPSRKGRTTVGGMVTKIEAAEKLIKSGTPLIVASGHRTNVLTDILSGHNVGTLFAPREGDRAIRGRKRWIGYHLPTKGVVTVDAGARDALENNGTSLLPSGITDVTGQFDRGDAIQICDQDDYEIGRGLTNYNPAEIKQLMGCQTEEISDILGYRRYDEIIHRDNLVLVNQV